MRSKQLFSSLALATAFAVTSLQGQVQVKVKVGRVYDPVHKDYHQWDDHEDRAYRAYLTENHQEYRVYGKQKKADQSRYWKWRHEHPDEHR